MRYFNYQCGQAGCVWNMFKELGSIPDRDRDPNDYSRCLYGHTLETMGSLMHKFESGVELDPDDFSLRAYEIKCQINDAKQQIEDAKDLLAIIDDQESEDKEVTRASFGQITETQLARKSAKTYMNMYDTVEDNDEFFRCMMSLYNINKVYITEQGTDLVMLLKSALRGIPSAIEHLASVLSSNLEIKGIISELCEVSTDGELLSALESNMCFA